MISEISYPAKHKSITCYLGQQDLDNGNILYLGFEELTQDNIMYWEQYYAFHKRQHMPSYFLDDVVNIWKKESILDKNIIKNFGYLQTYDQFSKFAKYSEAEGNMHDCDYQLTKYDVLYKRLYSSNSLTADMSNILQLRKISNQLKSIHQGAAVSDLISRPIGRIANYMVFGSTCPITVDTIARHCNPDVIFSYKKLGHTEVSAIYNYYHDVVISLPYATDIATPTFSHYGIFKNPLHIVDPNQKYRKVSIILKGFSAYVSGSKSNILGDKYFITIDPLRGLVINLEKAIGAKNIHLCSDKWHEQSFAPEILGENIVVPGLITADISSTTPKPDWSIKDPDTGEKSAEFSHCSRLYFKSENYVDETESGYRLNIPGDLQSGLILIKRERLELFYRASNKIFDPKIMLPIFNYLKKHNASLPFGIANEIVHAHKLDEKLEDLTLDSVTDLYTASIPDMASLTIFNRHDHIPESVDRIQSNLKLP